MKAYSHELIEKKWQKKWDKTKLYRVSDVAKAKKNEMILVEFPYPSGNLHVGHWYAFALPDMYARYRTMLGKNVLFPIGFDAFGLPAENAAIKRGVNPKTWTHKNMAHMRKQIASMGTMFDWSREVVTCEPAYYKWTQSLFLHMWKRGLVYRKKTKANWCPSCKTVLANEQVTSGACERCSTAVEQKDLPQWNIAITAYADRLVDDLDALAWPEAIKESQRNWIGRSEGAEIEFELISTTLDKKTQDKKTVAIFTTRPDTIFGATAIVLAPENSILKNIEHTIKNVDELHSYQEQAKRKTELERQENKEKTAVKLEGVVAINPANKKEIPVFVADYVLAGYGTGAIMAVPAHDERDREFALAHAVNIISVVNEQGLLMESGDFTGQNAHESKRAIVEYVGGKMKKTYRLRDWIVSRQRYWGVPIPMIYCKKCHTLGKGVNAHAPGYYPVPDKELPVVLPRVEDYLPTGEGKSPLAKATRWMKVKCPACKETAERETDTLDTFVCSSWYYLRYADPKNMKSFADKKKLASWLPVSLYSGGAEHTTMHLLYSRFWHKALYDAKMVPGKEPYTVRMNRGLILGPDGQKMSKSKGNVVDPDEVVTRLGTDTVRLYLAFIGPFNEVGSYPWNYDSIAGVRRFLERVWKLQEKITDSASKDSELALHQSIQKVSEDIAKLQFNTCISALMSLLNTFEKHGVTPHQFEVLLVLLAPLAPHITEELWHLRGHKNSIHSQKWPTYNKKLLQAQKVSVAIQVNGKVRGTIEVARAESEAAVLSRAKHAVESHLADKTIMREMYISGKIVSIVVG